LHSPLLTAHSTSNSIFFLLKLLVLYWFPLHIFCIKILFSRQRKYIFPIHVKQDSSLTFTQIGNTNHNTSFPFTQIRIQCSHLHKSEFKFPIYTSQNASFPYTQNRIQVSDLHKSECKFSIHTNQNACFPFTHFRMRISRLHILECKFPIHIPTQIQVFH